MGDKPVGYLQSVALGYRETNPSGQRGTCIRDLRSPAPLPTSLLASTDADKIAVLPVPWIPPFIQILKNAVAAEEKTNRTTYLYHNFIYFE